MFLCTKCGLCCRNIGEIPELREYDTGNGTCIHLTEECLCDIYTDRPDICNVEKMFDQKYKYLMTRDEYDYFNSAGCKKMQDEHLRKE